MKGTIIFVQSHTAQIYPEDLVGKYFFVKESYLNPRHKCTIVSILSNGTVRISCGNGTFYKLSEVDFEISYYEAKENN